MKKRLLSVLLCVSLLLTMMAGCGGAPASTPGTDAPAADTPADAPAEGTPPAEEAAVTTVGPDTGTKMNMWSFVDLHNEFYGKMLEKWNTANPDRQIQMTFTTYPYDDMHNKMVMALQTGAGAPDLCDIEIGKFPNFLKGEVQLQPLNDAIAPYKDDLVQARLDIYSKDGNYYGAPTHVGATVMYYNAELLEKYGIDYTTIETWDDYAAAGVKLKEASNGEVFMTSVDTASVDWMWVSMAEHGEDWTGGIGGKPNVELASVKKMLNMQQKWLKDGVAMISTDGHVDLEAGFANIMDGKIASFPKAMWFMSRFVGYMPEMTGKIALAPCPVFEAGQPRSVGIGGTGTVVTKQSADPKLAADFIAYAKCSKEGNVGIWEELGFDTCNTEIWTDEAITKNASNKYISYFRTNPFDVLNEIKEEIGKIDVTAMSPTINSYLCETTLNQILLDGVNVDEALKEAQDYIELEGG